MADIKDFNPQFEEIKKLVEKEIRESLDKPFIVSIMGQTGVGKSSLLNALFNTKLKTDPIRPCTKEIERIVIKGQNGQELWFYDMPGIGESDTADTKYLVEYKQKLVESDVIIWAIHADNRSVAFEQEAFVRLLGSSDRNYQVQLMSKITFVLTKVDLLIPPAWVFNKIGNYGLFTPLEITQQILEQKEAYYQEVFLQPYSDLIVSQTYNDSKLNVEQESLICDDYAVYYKGFLDKSTLEFLKQFYPQKHSAIFDRLYDNYRVIPCSALFKYNLNQLMLVIINKLGHEAVGRFQKFYSADELSQVPVEKAKEYCNLVVFDPNKKQVIFNLSRMKF